MQDFQSVDTYNLSVVDLGMISEFLLTSAEVIQPQNSASKTLLQDHLF